MSSLRPSAREIVEKGRAIYESRIRRLVEKEHFGKFLVLDILSGDYEIDADHLTASNRAAGKHPEGLLYATRIGYGAVGRIGARWRRSGA